MARVNEICEDLTAESQREIGSTLRSSLKRGQSWREAIGYALWQFVPLMDEAVDTAAAVPRPPADEAELEQFFDDVHEGVTLTRYLASTLKREDMETASQLNAGFAEIAGRTRPFAEDYGLIACLPDRPGDQTLNRRLA